jgi:hypothetical protein
LRVRLQPFELHSLEELAGEPGSFIAVTGLGMKIIDSLINNGSLGTTNAVHEQQWVTMKVDPAILK